MPQLSQIKVFYRRTKQPRQYETAEASAEAVYIFAEGEDVDVDQVLSDEFRRVQEHVEGTLGISRQSAKAPATKSTTTSKPIEQTDAKEDEKPARKSAKPPAPKTAAAPKPSTPSQDKPAPKLTKSDAMKAIAATMTALQKKGVTDGQKRIEKIVLGYLPDDKPPISYTRIPEHAIGDFIKDVEDLKNVNE